MTQKIRSQASRFWSVLVSVDTLNAYKGAIDVTVSILKEGIILIWLVLCLILVFFDWGAEKSKAAGQWTRDWYENVQTVDSTQIAATAKQSLFSAIQSSVMNTITQARQQLGLPEKESVPTPIGTAQVSASSGTSQPSVPSPAPITPAETASTDA